MNELELFRFPDTGQQIRGFLVEGEPWLVAPDVCAALAISNPRSSIALLDDDEKGVHSVDTPGGPQQMAIVNEPGLYSLILRSRKPQAKAFKRWVTHEVLPEIRKTGHYGVDARPAIPEDYAAALRRLADEVDARLLAEKQRDELKPLAEAYADLMGSDGLFDWAATAQIFSRITGGLGRNNFLELLRGDDLKILKENNTPYQVRELDRYFKVIPTKAGNDSTPTTRVTPEGLDWLRKRLIKHFNHQSALFAIGDLAS